MTDQRVVHFDNSASAEAALAAAGFSLGRLQRDDPRGVIHGDYDIMKWRNLRPSDRAALHGIFQRHGHDGLVTVTLRGSCPPDAVSALIAAALTPA